MKTRSSTFLAAAMLAAVTLPALSAEVVIRTPDTYDEFVPHATLRFGDTAEVKLNTNGKTCTFSLISNSGTFASLSEADVFADNEIRKYSALNDFQVASHFELSSCRDETGAPVDDFADGLLEIYDPAVVPQNGSCGSANSTETVAFPSLNTCSYGVTFANDEVGADGTFNWQCRGDHGGTAATCSAPRAPGPESPLYQATFAGSRAVTSSTRDTLSWSFPAAATCRASGSWSGNKAKSGSQTVTFAGTNAGTKIYTLTCTNATGVSGAKTVTLP